MVDLVLNTDKYCINNFYLNISIYQYICLFMETVKGWTQVDSSLFILLFMWFLGSVPIIKSLSGHTSSVLVRSNIEFIESVDQLLNNPSILPMTKTWFIKDALKNVSKTKINYATLKSANRKNAIVLKNFQHILINN